MMKKSVFLLFVAMFLAGCRSDIHYQNRAVERAREFLLENCSDLSDSEANFVRYNAPLLLHSPVLSGGIAWSNEETLYSDLKQICVAWMIPGKQDLYMVFGVSGARMDFWYPNRILIRNYEKHTPVMLGAVGISRAYAASNLFDELTVEESNKIRFTFPFLLRTNFDLNLDPAGTLSVEEYAEAENANVGRIQYSVVWKFGSRNVVFAGLADHGFINWNISMAQVIGEDELKKHTVAEVMTPADALKELPQAELQATVPAAESNATEEE